MSSHGGKGNDGGGGYANVVITGSGSSLKDVGIDHIKVNGSQPYTGIVMNEISFQDREGESDKDEQTEPPDVDIPTVGFFQLFRFSDGKDKLLMFLGTLAAIGNGSAFPVNLLIYGRVLNIFILQEIAKGMQPTAQTFTNLSTYSNPAAFLFTTTPAPPQPVWPQVQPLIVYFCLIGLGVLLLGYIEIAFWVWTAERQSRRIRTMFFHAILKQHIGWFDTHQSAELNTRLSDDIMKINSGIGDKLATLIQWMTTFFAGYIIGFTQNYKLTLVILSVAPLLVITLIFMAKMVQKLTIAEQSAYAKAGAIAEEALANIRTVAAFGGEHKEAERYNSNLVGARKVGVRRGFVSGVGQGMFWICIFGAFGLAFWYGSQLVMSEGVQGGSILQVFMGVMVGTMALGHAAPNLEYIASARGAAAAVFGIIDMESEIDSSSEEGEMPHSITGEVDFEGVGFSYPARPEVQVISRFTLKVRNGQTVALVGASGCGKSTVIQLLQRFYDPQLGQVKLDGRDVRELNVRWLRQNIGVVSQEPVLFATSIAENIRYGKDGVSFDEIQEAARQANAFDFIANLPDKFNTLVGARGAQLSGGQKQRIAIARALVANPKILLLDEATSALDSESERIVQDALDKARQGRTTIIIAHRLSTIRNANLIVGMSDGRVVEMGTHQQLMQTGSIYKSLVQSQTDRERKESQSEEEDTETYEVETNVNPIDNFNDLENEEGGEHIEIVDPLLVHREGISRSHSRTVSRSSSVRSFSHNDSTQHILRSSLIQGDLGRVDTISESSDFWTEEDEKELNEKTPPAPVKRIMLMNTPEWPYILIGCLSALITGAVHPTFSIFFSEILGNFANPDPVEQNRKAILFSSLIAGLGFIVALANLTQQYFFSLSGENLTSRLRKLAFSSMLRQDITWFDDRKNQVGALTTRLAADASAVRGAAGQQLGVIMQSIVNIILAVVIAFVFGWKLASIVVAFLPFFIFSGVAQGKLLQGYSKDDKELLEEGGKIAVEAIDNIRTVAALTQEANFEKNFNSHFDKMYWKGVKKAHIYGIFYSFSQCVVFFAYAATFSYGSQLIDTGFMKFREVFRVFAAITFGGQAVGRAGSYAPDIAKAKIAAGKLFTLFDTKPVIDSASNEGIQPDSCAGKVDFQSVRFHYPSRPEVEVLKRLNLSVQPGQTLALVGSSGCGKSTTVQLVERFYDALFGKVRLDGHCLKDLNVSWLRSKLGIVSQEPILFDASIKENIAYGNNSRDLPMDEIIKAARDANIHSFIQSLPQGYETNVGEKGTQLSGGQKQRVAIARALVRNPKVLLLDEATSALDTESELVVQEALDKARMGRTCITIAHRLSTIQNADIIAVIHNGRVVEQGSHVQLMKKKGYYYKLQQAQRRSYIHS